MRKKNVNVFLKTWLAQSYTKNRYHFGVQCSYRGTVDEKLWDFSFHFFQSEGGQPVFKMLWWSWTQTTAQKHHSKRSLDSQMITSILKLAQMHFKKGSFTARLIAICRRVCLQTVKARLQEKRMFSCGCLASTCTFWSLGARCCKSVDADRLLQSESMQCCNSWVTNNTVADPTTLKSADFGRCDCGGVGVANCDMSVLGFIWLFLQLRMSTDI